MAGSRRGADAAPAQVHFATMYPYNYVPFVCLLVLRQSRDRLRWWGTSSVVQLMTLPFMDGLRAFTAALRGSKPVSCWVEDKFCAFHGKL